MKPGGYTISEAAEKLGVSAGWLRLGERTQSLPAARRTPGGQRRYTDEDIAMLSELGVGERAAWIRQRNEARATGERDREAGVNEEEIYAERRKREQGEYALKNVKEGRYVFTVGPFEEVLWMLVALEGEGIPYKLLRYEDGGHVYYDVHPYDGSGSMDGGA